MPQKKSRTENGGNQKISSFFKPEQPPLRRSPRKRSYIIWLISVDYLHHINFILSLSLSPPRSRPREEEDVPNQVPLAKRSPGPTGSTPSLGPFSPEQRERMEAKKVEAEGKRIVKQFGVEAQGIGVSWTKALLPELKKPYLQQVRGRGWSSNSVIVDLCSSGISAGRLPQGRASEGHHLPTSSVRFCKSTWLAITCLSLPPQLKTCSPGPRLAPLRR